MRELTDARTQKEGLALMSEIIVRSTEPLGLTVVLLPGHSLAAVVAQLPVVARQLGGAALLGTW